MFCVYFSNCIRKCFLYFVIQIRATDRLSLFVCSPVHARLPAVGRTRHEAKVAPAGMLTVNARHIVVVNKMDRPNTTPTVRDICRFAVYVLVFRPFCRFALVYEGHFVLCYKEKTTAVRSC